MQLQWEGGDNFYGMNGPTQQQRLIVTGLPDDRADDRADDKSQHYPILQ